MQRDNINLGVSPQFYNPSKISGMYGDFRYFGSNTENKTLFFGISKGTFYKKSPLAGYGAAPHVKGDSIGLRTSPQFYNPSKISGMYGDV